MTATPDDLFHRALAVTLEFEGGYYPGNLKGDPNPTMKGIIQTTYDGWRGAKGLEPRPVRQISDAEVEAIYRTRFWNRAGCGDYGWPVALLVFDWSVNSGTGHAVRGLTQTGPRPRPYLEVRWAFLENLMHNRPSTEVFRRGWARRVNRLCAVAGVPPVAVAVKVAA